MGIVNAVDICKYPQHFNRLLLIAMNIYVLLLIFIFSCIGCGETNEQDANTIEGNTDTSQITIAPVHKNDRRTTLLKKGTILHLPVHEVVPGKYTPFHLTVLPSYTQLIDDKSHIHCGR